MNGRILTSIFATFCLSLQPTNVAQAASEGESCSRIIGPDEKGSLRLPCAGPDGFVFGSDSTGPAWHATVERGVYEVTVEYRSPRSAPTLRLQLQDGRFIQDQLLKKGEMRSGDEDKPQTQSLGPLAFDQHATVELNLTRVDPIQNDLVSVSAVILHPIGGTEASVGKKEDDTRVDGATRIMRTNREDGAEMVWIPGGEFIMGGLGGNDNHRFFLEGYWMYKLPVTVQQYRQFCEGTKREMPLAPKWGWIDNHPMVNVSWYEALAYARWAGVRLPSEAEWEKAGRGTDGRVLPWGNHFDSAKCQSPRDLHGFPGTAPVGFFPQGASPYGCLDMAGNVWQWCSSRIAPYPYQADDGREETDTYLDGERRTYRGGGFVMNSWRMDWTILHRGNYYPVEQDKDKKTVALRRDHIGFRCATSEPEPR